MTGPRKLPEGVNAPYLEAGALLTPELLREQEERFMEVLHLLMEKASEHGATMRTLGSIAFRIKCPDCRHLAYDNGRYLTDIDFIALSREVDRVQDMFLGLGWLENQTVLRLFGHRRRIFHHPEVPLHSDVFLDSLNFCHELDLRKRLQIDYPTISVTDLLLEKLQIVEINRKDLIDVMVLLSQHAVDGPDSRDGGIDGGRVAGLFSRDWGWWRTGTENLRKVHNYSGEYLSEEDAQLVRERTGKLMRLVEDRGKSIRWKLRSLIGERMRWYDEVEEVERD